MTALPLGITTRLVSFLTQAVSTFLLVAIFFFLQYIFDMEFKCSCKPGVDGNTVLFMVLPPLILAWFVNIIIPIHKRKTFLKWCSQEQDVFCRCVWKGTTDYICLLVVWFSAVLFKGDWYLCLWTNLSEDHTGIPCRINLTFEEEQIKAEYKNDSLNIGLIVSCVFVVLWSCVEMIHFCCVRGEECCEGFYKPPKPHYREIYEGLLQEEVKSHLKDELTKIAKKRAKNICRSHLTDIEFQELNPNDDDCKRGWKIWWKISASNFHTTDLIKPEPMTPLENTLVKFYYEDEKLKFSTE